MRRGFGLFHTPEDEKLLEQNFNKNSEVLKSLRNSLSPSSLRNS